MKDKIELPCNFQRGDILIAAPDRTAPAGHYWRPVVVISVQENGVLAAYCTSKEKAFADPSLYLKLDAGKYSLDRDSYLYVNKIFAVRRSAISRHIGRLDDEDFRLVQEKLMDAILEQGLGRDRMQPKSYLKGAPFDKGDVITLRGERGRYLVYRAEKDHAVAFKATTWKSSDYAVPIKTHLGKYWVDERAGRWLETPDFDKAVVMDWSLEEYQSPKRTSLFEQDLPIGQILKNQIDDLEYVYLYSRSGTAYGICLDDYFDFNQTNLMQLDVEHCTPEDCISYELELEILGRMRKQRSGPKNKLLGRILSGIANNVRQERLLCS